MKKGINLYLRVDKYQDLRRVAYKKEISTSRIIDKLIENYLKKNSYSENKKIEIMNQKNV